MISDDIIRSNLGNTIGETNFPLLGTKHQGKVRDSYKKDGKRMIVCTDRISAFDHIMRQFIPFKGQVLNQLAAFFMKATEDIVPNHIIEVPDPNVTVAKECEVYPIEVIVRGYLTGSAWRGYKAGERTKSGVTIPDGMKMNEKFKTPIVTPSTKADEGHDMDISKQEIIDQGLVPKLVYEKIEEKALELFERGTKMAAERGLILVDTKYEFGAHSGELTLIDEVHTPDSSRYFYQDSYQENFQKEYKQQHLSKEFLREWLMSKGFQGNDFETLPDLDDDIRIEVASRYIQLYEQVTGEDFVIESDSDIAARIENNLKSYF